MREKKPVTHTAFALKREGRGFRWIEIGVGRAADSGKDGHHEIMVDRLPVGGFDGRIHLSPIGTRPPEPIQEPVRPQQGHEPTDPESEP